MLQRKQKTKSKAAHFKVFLQKENTYKINNVVTSVIFLIIINNYEL